jgi:hypothetical protein
VFLLLFKLSFVSTGSPLIDRWFADFLEEFFYADFYLSFHRFSHDLYEGFTLLLSVRFPLFKARLDSAFSEVQHTVNFVGRGGGCLNIILGASRYRGVAWTMLILATWFSQIMPQGRQCICWDCMMTELKGTDIYLNGLCLEMAGTSLLL